MNAIDLKERIAINDAFSSEERTFLLEAINLLRPTQGAGVEVVVGHDPRNYLGRIDRLWAYLSVDDGGEGVCSGTIGRVQMPMIGADLKRVTSLRPMAVEIATMFGKPVRLAKFHMREDIEIIQP